jgi:hypothetical protein
MKDISESQALENRPTWGPPARGRRMIDGERTSKVYDSDEVRAGKAADPTLRSGDIIVVDRYENIPGVASMGRQW